MQSDQQPTFRTHLLIALLLVIFPAISLAEQPQLTTGPSGGWLFFFFFMAILLLAIASWLKSETKKAMRFRQQNQPDQSSRYAHWLHQFDSRQLSQLLSWRQKKRQSGTHNSASSKIFLLLLLLGSSTLSMAQDVAPAGNASILSETGIVITIVLLLIPILAGIIIMMLKVMKLRRDLKARQDNKKANEFAAYLQQLPEDDLDQALQKRKEALDFSLQNNELSGQLPAEDKRGLVNNASPVENLPVVALKKKAVKRPHIDPRLAKLVLWYLAAATFWLLFGTSIGEYVGIKFVAPDADHISWLSFGRLRPVHTNSVFWGWASLAMLGLGYYAVPRVSNTKLYSYRWGWYALILINAAVIIGSLCLMAGINNGGGEYREYVWPVMAMFGLGLLLTLINFLRTIARRTTKEIYISNWYIVSAIIFTLVIAAVAYLPWWQDGLGETIVQGYYMHQGVGMWFMLFTLGLVYYFLPQQLNKPIYSYSLGILAFWTQILFYTLIGSHHFVFSSIPWWLQTVAIVGSAGMAIPVTAGTTNFIMTFKGSWYKIADSYTLPFFLVGIIFYFTGSMQGTAEAFRSTNLIWHFTDFTVAHSHLTMYGIICFFMWAGIYAVVPRLTGQEPPQITVGAHFWMALIGLLFYTVPLMIGSTLKGLLWLNGKPFMEGVVLMAPYWLWRAIGGSLMWLSHIFFAYNMYRMYKRPATVDIKQQALNQLQDENLQPSII